MPYFDYNATTPLRVSARKRWLAAQDEDWYNPSSPYGRSARVHELLEGCRARLAQLLGCAPELLVFNSGATEGNYSLFEYLQSTLSRECRVGISAVEHPSVYAAAHALFGERCCTFKVNQSGVIDVEAFEEALDRDAFGLVSVMAANNETGVLQPWPQLASICRAKGVPFHVDAAQWLGKARMGPIGTVDFVTGCAHKFGGPKGVGFLKIGTNYTGYRAAVGGAQEHAHRAGTENYPGIAAMMAALEACLESVEAECSRLQICRNAFEEQIVQRIQGVNTIGADVGRLANTSLLIMPAHLNTRWVLQLEKRGFEVSTGSACATGKEGPSHVLTAMGLSPEEARRAVRVSGGWNTTNDDWRALAAAMIVVWERLKREERSNQVIDI